MEKRLLTPRPELLVGRSQQAAKEAGERASALLNRNNILFASATINMLTIRAEMEARDAYLQARLEGRANDEASIQPGMTVFLTSQGVNRVGAICDEVGTLMPRPQIDPLISDISVMELQYGVFSDTDGQLQLYQYAEVDANAPGRWKSRWGGLRLEPSHILRIEGNANELWQNPNFDWDGSPKAQTIPTTLDPLQSA